MRCYNRNMIWIVLAVVIVGYFIYQAIQQNIRNNTLIAHTEIVNSPAYIKKETDGKRLYVKKIFDIAERDLETRENITDEGVRLFPVNPRKHPESNKLPTMQHIEGYKKEYQKVMEEKQKVYNAAIKELDKDSFFIKYDFMKNGENPYDETFFELDGNEDLKEKYIKLAEYSEKITAKHDEVESQIEFLSPAKN